MKKTKTTLAAIGLLMGLSGVATAQDAHAGHTMGGAADLPTLPEICGVADAAPADAMSGMEGGMEMSGDLDEAHQALMGSMTGMHETMMGAMSAEDIDVAFVCGMIPHHQGAIAMAEAELEFGDDPWARELAEQIIATQEAEIAAMLAWLEEQAAQ